MLHGISLQDLLGMIPTMMLTWEIECSQSGKAKGTTTSPLATRQTIKLMSFKMLTTEISKVCGPTSITVTVFSLKEQ